MSRDVSRRAFVGGLLATAGAAASAAACAGGGGESESGDGPQPTAAGSGASTTAAPGTPPTAPVGMPAELAAVRFTADPFTLGVASGDPDATSVVLWTRLAPDPFVAGSGVPAGATGVLVEVAAGDDEAFAAVLASAVVPVDAARGHSVHAVLDGLPSGARFRYRFRIGDRTSPAGLTRTAPADGDDVTPRLAVASCQRYDHGWFAAHRSIAAADVDLVVFVGDYVYEAGTAIDAVRALPGPAADREVSDLDGYRSRYVAARLDPDLGACHAAHPWVVTWDDHEIGNDVAGGDAVDPARRAAAYQAWWEHQPVRLPPPPADGTTPWPIHRSIRWGSELELLVLDTRQFRSPQACGGGAIDVRSCTELDAPGRTMLGDEQETWVADRLAAASTRWVALAQSVVFSPVVVAGQANSDAWDGYPAAQAALVDAIAASPASSSGAGGVVVLSGDVHVELVADVPGRDGVPVATELVTPSISSRAGSFGELAGLLPVLDGEVVHAADTRGWLRCEAGPDGWLATFHEVVDVADPAGEVVEGPSFRIAAGEPGALPA